MEVKLFSFGFLLVCCCHLLNSAVGDNQFLVQIDKEDETKGKNVSSGGGDVKVKVKSTMTRSRSIVPSVLNLDGGTGNNKIQDIELDEEALATFGNVSATSLLPLFDDERRVVLDDWVAPYEIRKKFPYYLSGYDTEGRPIWVAEIGRWDVRPVVNAGEEQVKNLERYLEQAGRRALASLNDKSTPDNPVSEAIAIIDVDGMTVGQVAHVPSVTLGLKVARRFRSFVAKHMHVGLVVNTNTVAQSLINIGRPILGNILDRMEIYGTNKQRWMPHLLKHCPRDQVAPWYGGTKDFRPVKVYG